MIGFLRLHGGCKSDKSAGPTRVFPLVRPAFVRRSPDWTRTSNVCCVRPPAYGRMWGPAREADRGGEPNAGPCGFVVTDSVTHCRSPRRYFDQY